MANTIKITRDELANLLFKNIDWELLTKQKLALMDLRDEMLEERYAFLDGVLNLIDHFQDVAVESGYRSEKEVFNLD